MTERQPRIFVAGHRGMVGSAIIRRLQELGYTRIITRTRQELDLRNQSAVNRLFQTEAIDQVYLAAAKVGGIHANNTYPAEFLYDNLVIEANIINASFISDVGKLLFLGSSCIYPRDADQPMREESLLSGPLEPTNEPYAVAKIAGIKLCESFRRQYGLDYRSIMPTNLYGPGDNFHPTNSHVIPALIRRFHEAKTKHQGEVTVWGSGRPRREFLHVDDLASGAVHIMELPSSVYREHIGDNVSHINIGTGKDCSIRELAAKIAAVVGFDGDIRFDTSQPDGMPRKLLDVSRINALGWKPTIPLLSGLRQTYEWYRSYPDADSQPNCNFKT